MPDDTRRDSKGCVANNRRGNGHVLNISPAFSLSYISRTVCACVFPSVSFTFTCAARLDSGGCCNFVIV